MQQVLCDLHWRACLPDAQVQSTSPDEGDGPIELTVPVRYIPGPFDKIIKNFSHGVQPRFPEVEQTQDEQVRRLASRLVSVWREIWMIWLHRHKMEVSGIVDPSTGFPSWLDQDLLNAWEATLAQHGVSKNEGNAFMAEFLRRLLDQHSDDLAASGIAFSPGLILKLQNGHLVIEPN
ncbi:MAG: hypothetical protein D6698_06185 [Gammaproteobacteria bacterium]|nr:MAG: hypothetical protein D6698_06185 [Gammaproteobacteria bacterium]